MQEKREPKVRQIAMRIEPAVMALRDLSSGLSCVAAAASTMVWRVEDMACRRRLLRRGKIAPNEVWRGRCVGGEVRTKASTSVGCICSRRLFEYAVYSAPSPTAQLEEMSAKMNRR